MVVRMRDEKYCWIFDSNEDFKIFQKARKGGLLDHAAREIFGRAISREESYKKTITLRQMEDFYEKSVPEMDPALRNYLVQVSARDWMSGLASCLAGMFPEGSLTLPRLVHFLSLNKEISRCEVAGDLPKAKSLLGERASLAGEDSDAVELAEDFIGLRGALSAFRVKAGVEVMASLAWDCFHAGMGEMATYRKLFLSSERNQKGRIKSPQRVFFEWLEKCVYEIDREIGYARGIDQSVHHIFFIGAEEGKKYFRGDKKFSLQEYDAKLSDLWPLACGKEMDDVAHSILSKIVFCLLGQQLYDEVSGQSSGDDFDKLIIGCIEYFEKYVEFLVADGEFHLERMKELMRGVKGLESPPAP